MSRALSAGHLTEIALRAGNAQAYLVALTAGATTFRWATFGEITHATFTWLARDIRFSGLTSDGAFTDGVTMDCEDIAGDLRALVQIEDGDLSVQVYAMHKAATGTIEATQVADAVADEPRWDATAGRCSFTLRSAVPLELPGLSIGVATGLGELIAPGTEFAFGDEIIVLEGRA